MPAKKRQLPSISEEVRRRRPEALTMEPSLPSPGFMASGAADPITYWLNEAFKRIAPDIALPDEALQYIDPSEFTGVTEAVKKVPRVWLTKHDPSVAGLDPIAGMMRALSRIGESIPITGGPGRRTGMASKALAQDKPLLVRSQAFTSPQTAATLRIAGKTPEEAEKIAGSVPVHETIHGLINTYFPFLRTGGTTARDWAKNSVEELIASMLQSYRTGGMSTGILGSFSKAVKQYIKDPDEWNRIVAMALREPRRALEIVIDEAKLSPKQKEAILSAPGIRNYDELIGRAVEKLRSRTLLR